MADVPARPRGPFRPGPSARDRWRGVVGGSYERGDRAVTVQRLSELAVFYGVPVSELLPDPRPSSAVTKSTKIVLNLESLSLQTCEVAGLLARYASVSAEQSQ